MLNHNATTFNHLEFRIVYKLAARLEGESACHTRSARFSAKPEGPFSHLYRP